MMTKKNVVKYRQFVYRPADDDSLLESADADLMAYSTLPKSREKEPISRIKLIKSGKYTPKQTVMHRVWLHDILDDYKILYLVEVMGVFIGRRDFGQMQGIYVLDSDLEKALDLMMKFEKAPQVFSNVYAETELSHFSDDGVLQSKCSYCGRDYDFDYTKCPYCNNRGVNTDTIKEKTLAKEGVKVRTSSTKNKHINLLYRHIFRDDTIANEIEANMSSSVAFRNQYAVFLSLCDARKRASVVKGVGNTLIDAWDSAEQAATAIIERRKFNIKWAKADIVNSAKNIRTTDLNKELIKVHHRYFFREGIAMDSEFDVAFLEGEINGNKLINYYTEKEILNRTFDHYSVVLDHDNINKYQSARDGIKVTSLPEKIIVFSTAGFFCDDELEIYELFGKGPACGRRIIEPVNPSVVSFITESAYDYLDSMIKPDGEFVYGYYPIYDNEIDNYNILRHAGSVWSLIKLYSVKKNAGLADRIVAAIEYLKNGFITYRDDTTAFVIERKSDELKLGGNALAVIMLVEYMEVFETDKYSRLVKALANGILEMQNRRTGVFFHILGYPDFEPLDAFRTIYYDGEATFALVRAYAYTGYEKYLNGAKHAVENFIEKDYTRFRDHWVSYALNEITKHVADVNYFEFAVKNAGNNLKRISVMTRVAQTSFELLTVAWQTLVRARQQGIESRYLKKFDDAELAKTIFSRAQHLLNGFFFPEIAMYMKYPEKAVGTFYIREDNFKIRIDEIQHFILGYKLYCDHYEELLKYLQ